MSFAAASLQAVRPPSREELMRFYRNLGVMLQAGVSFSASFTTLSEGLTDERMRVVCQDLSHSIEQSGESLSAAMRRRTSVFSSVQVGLVEAGEANGDVSQALVRLADLEERSWKVQQRLRSALTYPVFVLGLCGLVLGVFLPLYVFPQMLAVLESLRVPETGLTGVVMGVMRAGPWLLAVFLAGAGFVVFHAFGRRRERLIRSLLRALVWVPGLRASLRMAIRQARSEEALLAQWEALLLDYGGPVGRALQQTLTVRFCLALGAALDSGVELQKALEVSVKATGSRLLDMQLREVREALRGGASLSGALSSTSVFPFLLLRMIAVGEETSTVPELCLRTARLYEEELESTLQSALALLEPCLMVVLGGIVGGILLVMLVPLLGALQAL